MELTKYLFPLRKWWWLIAASTAVAIIFSLLTSLRQPTFYQARTTLMIGTTITDPNPSTNELFLGQQLAAAYADIANREILLNATKNALGMNRLPQYIARALPNTQFIEITVKDTDPERAQKVANELAAQLILLNPISAQPEERGRQAFIYQRLNELEAQIKETEAEIDKLQEELAGTFSAQQINEKQDQISSLQSKLNAIENNYGLLLSNTQQGAINTLTIIETAEVPSTPIGPRKGLTILLAAAVGFVLAACEAYLLEYLDDTLKTPDEVIRLFSAPIIGRIFEQASGMDENELYDSGNLDHPITEQVRALRTAIDFSETTQPLKIILVTSPDVGDGKTSVAVNLALSIAQRNKNVFLLDADMRKPRIHKLFNLVKEKGLADLGFAPDVFDWKNRIKKVREVTVLTAGNTPLDPAEILSSKKTDRLLSELKDAYDVVIIDGPPLFIPDTMILATKVDGILMVVRPSHTRRSMAKAAVENIKLVGARVFGIVLNRIPLRGADYYAGESYLYTYYQSNYSEESEGSENKTELEKLVATLSSYINKASNFLKNLFRTVFKLSEK
jgi:capsular exopolysaccharide synthesis family protein